MGLIDRFKRGASGAETLGGFVTGGTLGMLTGMETETSKKSRAQEQSVSALNQFFDSMAKRLNLTDEQISNVQSARKLTESMVNSGSKIDDALKAASIVISGNLDNVENNKQKNQAISYVDPNTGQTMIGTYNPYTNEFKDISGNVIKNNLGRGYAPAIRENPTTQKLDKYNPVTGKLEQISGQEGDVIKSLPEASFGGTSKGAEFGANKVSEQLNNVPDKGFSLPIGVLIDNGNALAMRAAVNAGIANEDDFNTMQAVNIFKQNFLFGDAGKALTGTERSIIERNLNVTGKSKSQIKTDLRAAEIKFNEALKRNGQKEIDFGLSGINSDIKEDEQVESDKFTVGKQYKDSKGRKAIYKGNGKWEVSK